MPLPLPVERLWDELQSARVELLREAEGLSQRQADWKPSERDWSVGEIVDHLTLAEIDDRQADDEAAERSCPTVRRGAFPNDLTEFAAVPDGPAGRAEAPPSSGPCTASRSAS